MLGSRGQQRKRRTLGMTLDALEGRQMLTGGMGSTFAIVPGAIAEPNTPTSVEIRLDPTHFQAGPRGRIILGVDVAAEPGSQVKPEVSGFRAANGRNIGIQRSMYTQTLVQAQGLLTPRSTAVTSNLTVPREGQAPNSYRVDVRGLSEDTGKFLLGFYLPGDVNGDGTVSKTDVQEIASRFGATAGDDAYLFDADANRDGRIDFRDIRIAGQNVGARTVITPVASVNLDNDSDTGLSDRITDQRVVRFHGVVSPGAAIRFREIAANAPDATATAGQDGNYSIDVQLGDGSNTFQVSSADSFGQVIDGAIAPVTYRLNPPTLPNIAPGSQTFG